MKTRVFGILNLTPDSFSDGGRYIDTDDLYVAACRMNEAGAYGIDVGAESTRPGARPLSPEKEWERLKPFFHDVWPRLQSGGLRLSIDTRHAETAARALEYGAHWINDVSGFADAAMVAAVRDSDCMLVAMHSLTVPADMAITLPEDCDPVNVLRMFFEQRIAALESSGITRARLVLDPGIGFGKTAAQSWQIIQRISELKTLGLPLLVGHSRKSFLGGTLAERDAATLAVSKQLMQSGVEFLRVHEVAAHVG